MVESFAKSAAGKGCDEREREGEVKEEYPEELADGEAGEGVAGCHVVHLGPEFTGATVLHSRPLGVCSVCWRASVPQTRRLFAAACCC